MAENTPVALSADVAKHVIKRAQQKALVRDAVKVLQGIRKTAAGATCPGGKIRSGGKGRGLGKGKGKGPIGVPIGAKAGASSGKLPESLKAHLFGAKKKKGEDKAESEDEKKASVLSRAVEMLKAGKAAKAASPARAFVKAAAVALIAIKRGTKMQKQAAIGELLRRLATKLGGKATGAATGLLSKIPHTGGLQRGILGAAGKLGSEGMGYGLAGAGGLGALGLGSALAGGEKKKPAA